MKSNSKIKKYFLDQVVICFGTGPLQQINASLIWRLYQSDPQFPFNKFDYRKKSKVANQEILNFFITSDWKMQAQTKLISNLNKVKDVLDPPKAKSYYLKYPGICIFFTEK